MEERIGGVTRAQHGVVTRAQLVDAGLAPGAIRHRIASGRLRVLHRGVYATGPMLLPHARDMAAVLACGPEALLSHRSAAAASGLIEPIGDQPVDVTVPHPFDRGRPGIRVRRSARLAVDERTCRDGIPITSVARTLIDLGTVLPEHRLERCIAHAEREGLVTRAELLECITRHRGRVGIRRVRAVVERAGGPSLTRSEAERRFLTLVRTAGLPSPGTNVAVGEYEVDFLWREHGIAVEIDGYRFHSSRPRFEADRRRAASLAALGIQVIPLTWAQVVDDAVATAVQIGQALVRRGPA